MKDNIRVLHVISNPCIGGAQSIIRDIVTHNKNHYIYTFRRAKEDMFRSIKDKVFYYNSDKNYKFNPRIIFDMCRIVDKKNIQILHLHLNKPLIYASILKIFRPKLKLIYHEHGPILIPNKNKDYFEYNTSLKLFHSQADKFILVSKTVANAYAKKLNEKGRRVSLLYNFIDFHRFNGRKGLTDPKYSRKKLKISKDDYCIGFVGRLSRVKGCQYLIDALPYLKFNFKLVIVGNGELKKDLKRQVAKLKLKEKVIFLGYHSDVYKIYSLFDVLVMPSLHEAFGLVICEAQAAGVPVVSSDVAAINEFIIDEHNGLLFKVKDSSDLAKKIMLIHGDAVLRKKIAGNALKSVRKYSLKKYLKDLNEVYTEVLNEKKNY